MLGGWPKGRELWDGVTSGDQGLGGRPRPSCRLGTCLRRFPERKLKAAVCCPSSNSSSVPCPCAPSTGAPRGISISDPISLVPSAQLIQILAHPTALWSLGGRRDAEAVKSRVCSLHPQLTQLDTWSRLLPAVSSPASVMSVFLPSQAFLSVPPMGSIKPGLSLGRTVQEDPEMPDDTATPCPLPPAASLPCPHPTLPVGSAFAPWLQTVQENPDCTNAAARVRSAHFLTPVVCAAPLPPHPCPSPPLLRLLGSLGHS